MNNPLFGFGVTLLELNTLAYAGCDVLLYILWWRKPIAKDVNEPLVIPIDALVAVYSSRAPVYTVFHATAHNHWGFEVWHCRRGGCPKQTDRHLTQIELRFCNLLRPTPKILRDRRSPKAEQHAALLWSPDWCSKSEWTSTGPHGIATFRVG